MATGWTFEQVGDLTLQEFSDLQRYLSDHPPLHIMVARYLGYKPVSTEPKKHTTAEELMGIVSEFSGLRGNG